MSEGAEKSASGGADAARAEETREWRHARAAGRVVLAMIAAAVLLATWAMSPGLYTRTVEARVAAGDTWQIGWASAGGETEQRSGAWLDARITGEDARIGVPSWVRRVEVRRLDAREASGAALACELVEQVGGVGISRVALREGVTEVGGRWGVLLAVRIGLCAFIGVVMAAMLRVLARATLPRQCPSGTAGPLEAARWARVLGAAPVVVVAVWTLVSPTMMCPDSVDYVANAMRLMDTGSFAHFDGWRSPGYSIVLLGLLAFGKHAATAAGVLNGLMVIATMLLSAKACWLIVGEATGNARRAERGAAWAAAAVMWVIGLDPWVMLWTRHVMPECASMLVVAVVVRVLVGMATAQARGVWRTIAIGAAMGLFVGGACYLRGNFQLLVACVPACIGVCVLARGGGFGRAVVVGGACAACAVGTLLPWIVRTHARTGEWSFTTGGQFAKALFAQETGLMDWNQSEAFEFDHMLRLAAMRDAGTLGAYPFVHEMNTGKLAALGDAKLPQLVNTDRRARVMVEKSLARRPAMRNVLAMKAMSTQVGVWAFDVPGYRENAYWAGALRGSGGRGGDAKGPTGGDNQWADPASQTHLPKELVERVHARTTRSIEAYRGGAAARVFDAWWSVGSIARMAVAWVGVIGVGGVVLKLAREVLFGASDGARDAARDAAWVRGAVCVVLIAGLVAAHGAAIAWVVMTGLDRYAVAMIPVSAVAAASAWGVLVHGLSAPAR